MAYIRLKRAVKVFSNPFEPHVAESSQKTNTPIFSGENLSDPPYGFNPGVCRLRFSICSGAWDFGLPGILWWTLLAAWCHHQRRRYRTLRRKKLKPFRVQPAVSLWRPSNKNGTHPKIFVDEESERGDSRVVRFYSCRQNERIVVNLSNQVETHTLSSSAFSLSSLLCLSISEMLKFLHSTPPPVPRLVVRARILRG